MGHHTCLFSVGPGYIYLLHLFELYFGYRVFIQNALQEEIALFLIPAAT